MAELRDIICFLCKAHSNVDILSKARMTKLVYLSDWRSAITRGKQVSGVRWYYNHYGPYVDDIENTAKTDGAFSVTISTNSLGKKKEVIQLRQNFEPRLEKVEKETLEYVALTTSKLTWTDFIRLIYSTFPIVVSPQYSTLNLVEIARDYKTEEVSKIVDT